MKRLYARPDMTSDPTKLSCRPDQIVLCVAGKRLCDHERRAKTNYPAAVSLQSNSFPTPQLARQFLVSFFREFRGLHYRIRDSRAIGHGRERYGLLSLIARTSIIIRDIGGYLVNGV